MNIQKLPVEVVRKDYTVATKLNTRSAWAGSKCKGTLHRCDAKTCFYIPM